jgi:hypothetical protein
MRITGAAYPIVSKLGNKPIMRVGRAINPIEKTNAFFLPKRSPTYPKRNAPKGRVQKAAEKAKKLPNKARVGLVLGKKTVDNFVKNTPQIVKS